MGAFVHPPVESGRKTMEITDKNRRRLLTAYSVELDRVDALRRTLSPCLCPTFNQAVKMRPTRAAFPATGGQSGRRELYSKRPPVLW
jgi:hypothetical protein